jgi:hypothetical protein
VHVTDYEWRFSPGQTWSLHASCPETPPMDCGVISEAYARFASSPTCASRVFRNGRPGYAAGSMKSGPLHFLIFTVAGWLQRRREAQVAYLLAENAVYKEHFAKGGPRLTDAQRRRLAVKGKAVGRKELARIATICTPVGALYLKRGTALTVRASPPDPWLMTRRHALAPPPGGGGAVRCYYIEVCSEPHRYVECCPGCQSSAYSR